MTRLTISNGMNIENLDTDKRYAREATGPLAVASGVTWLISRTRNEYFDGSGTFFGRAWFPWRWSLGSRGSAAFLTKPAGNGEPAQTVNLPALNPRVESMDI